MRAESDRERDKYTTASFKKFPTGARGVLVVSIGKDDFEGDALLAMVDLINDAHRQGILQHITVLACDTLQAHTLLIDKKSSPDRAVADAARLGIAWRERNKQILDEIQAPCEIRHWDDFVRGDALANFEKCRDEFARYVKTKPGFKAALDQTVTAFFSHGVRKGQGDATNRHLCETYLIEETAVFYQLAQHAGCNIFLYPGGVLQVWQWVYDYEILPTQPDSDKPGLWVKIDLKSRLEAAPDDTKCYGRSDAAEAKRKQRYDEMMHAEEQMEIGARRSITAEEDAGRWTIMSSMLGIAMTLLREKQASTDRVTHTHSAPPAPSELPTVLTARRLKIYRRQLDRASKESEIIVPTPKRAGFTGFCDASRAHSSASQDTVSVTTQPLGSPPSMARSESSTGRTPPASAASRSPGATPPRTASPSGLCYARTGLFPASPSPSGTVVPSPAATPIQGETAAAQQAEQEIDAFLSTLG